MRKYIFIILLLTFTLPATSYSKEGESEIIYGIGIIREPIKLNLEPLLSEEYQSLSSQTIDLVSFTLSKVALVTGSANSRNFPNFYGIIGYYAGSIDLEQNVSFTSGDDSYLLQNIQFKSIGYYIEASIVTLGININNYNLQVKNTNTAVTNIINILELEYFMGVNFGYFLSTEYFIPYMGYTFNKSDFIERKKMVTGLTIIF
ncbi:MAG: hypothetical protein COB67_03190 [SAR324 cluster bacterium]|uniref:Uncharacterized protein n=1 Tax=SAR324 cluster bacterium TaxID=2024889 RepID=A0A2A4T8S5_9DELT|nr:MAG: hypothetical protein COB67_03190 [SAR324 cluster bacterium]